MTNIKHPLADRMRPTRLEDIAGQTHILGPGKQLRRMIEADQISSIILYGPPGTGKTTIARVIAEQTNAEFKTINATTSGKADMKAVVDKAIALRDESDRRTILFIDEIHRFNKAQQDYLLPYVENGTIVLIGATTENPFHEVNKALLSRSQIFELKPLEPNDIESIIRRVAADKENGYGNDMIYMSREALDALKQLASGDARKALNILELAVATTPIDSTGYKIINEGVIAECSQKPALYFDKNGDNHYDLISALIKSMRHSHADAAAYWLARLVESGEDPKFIARRLIIFASEDIGLADSNALAVSTNAFLAVECVGMPEGYYALMHATLYNALAPKSHTVTETMTRASELAVKAGNVPVPPFLRDAHYAGAAALGRGGNINIYDTRDHFAGVNCLPDEIRSEQIVTLGKPFGDEHRIKPYHDWYSCNRQK